MFFNPVGGVVGLWWPGLVKILMFFFFFSKVNSAAWASDCVDFGDFRGKS